MDPQARQAALQKLPYGMFLIGAADGDKVGAFTAAWISQCSFTPPMIMLGVKQGSGGRALIEASRAFAVSVLGAGQMDMAVHFFQRQPRTGNTIGDYTFRVGRTGAPIFEDAIAYFECEVRQVAPAGDHDVVIAEVIDAGIRSDAGPLLLKDTGYTYGG